MSALPVTTPGLMEAGMFAKAPASPADLLRASPARPAANGVWAPASSRSPAVSGVSVD